MAKNLENTLLPELERMRLDTRWVTEYYEELADVKNVLDDFNVVRLVVCVLFCFSIRVKTE